MACPNLTERVSTVEEFVGEAVAADSVPLANQCLVLREDLEHIRRLLENHLHEAEERWGDLSAKVEALTTRFEAKIEKVEDELTLLKRAAAGGSLGGVEGHSKLKIPEPKTFRGTRSSNDLENFVWDMEQYFKAAHIKDTEQVTITSMYLVGDAKLWWRTRTEDDLSAGRPKIQTWEGLKKELKDQFLPCNTAWLSREGFVKALKQLGSVRDYVMEFSSLLLDVKNMSEEDKLFNFMSGLKRWAQAELRRQNVKDLPSAIAAADSLVDLKLAGSFEGAKVEEASKKDQGVSKDKGKKDKKRSDGVKGDAKAGGQKARQKPKGCYICGGPHLMRECPKRERLNALVADSEDDQNETDVKRVNPLRLVNAMQIMAEDGKERVSTKRMGAGARPFTGVLDTAEGTCRPSELPPHVGGASKI